MKFINQHRRLLSIILSVLILVLIVVKLMMDKTIIDRIDQTVTLLFSGSVFMMMVFLILSPMNWLTEAVKWRFLLSKIQSVPIFKALGSVLSGMSFALISPGKVGDFAGRILYLDSAIRWRAFFMTIIGSFSHILVTCCMGAVGLVYLSVRFQSTLFLSLLFAAIFISILGVFLFLRMNTLKFKRKKMQRRWMRKLLVSLQIVRRYKRGDLSKVLFLSLLKFIIYNTQFVIVTQMLGSELGFGETFLASCVMFWMIMVIPSFFMADVIIRGMIATLIFEQTGMISDTLPFISASYIIWLVNWVLPSCMGGLVFFLKNMFNSHLTTKHR